MFHSDLQTYLLGTKERTDNCNLWVTQHVAAGSETEEAMMMTPFSSREEWDEYKNMTGEIKNMIAHANKLRDMSIITEQGLKTRIATIWYPLTVKFIKRFGKEMVPFDIRWAINDVETYVFESTPTGWPSHVLYEP